jgi:hypothetical protein
MAKKERFLKINKDCFKGKIYCPDFDQVTKNKCLDCFSCQKCNQDRCSICRGEKNERCKSQK